MDNIDDIGNGWFEGCCYHCGEPLLIHEDEHITVQCNPEGEILGICCHICVRDDVGAYTRVPKLEN